MIPTGRNEARRLLGLFRFSQVRSLTTTMTCFAIALVIAFVPEYPGLSVAGHRTLFVLVLAAGMWVTEAIPAFATSLLAIGCLIALLGRPEGVYAHGEHDWEQFIAPWGSPLIWLFFGGFCLALSAEKTGLDRWIAARVLGLFGQRPGMLLLGIMLVTGVLSMFMSNTATATLVLAMMTPIFASRAQGDGVSKAICLGVAFASNIGGMGTIIGTPPNAIAAGLLEGESAVNFAEWMVLGTPPAFLMLLVAWFYLVVVHLKKDAFSDEKGILFYAGVASDPTPLHKQYVVIGTFIVTVSLWMTSPLHGLPTTVVSFVPIVVLTTTGILTGADIRTLPWDILLLITGGLSLGVAIEKTGLATWAVGYLPLEGLSPVALALGFSYATLLMANLMSHTASANIILPISIAVLTAAKATGGDTRLAVPIALAASAGMCLPISTPPNAIVYSGGHLKVTDMFAGGLLIGLIAPVLLVFWAEFVLNWL